MKKFIFKTTFFLTPVMLLFIIAVCFYSSSESPDLVRLGYLPNVYKDYRSVFSKEFNRKIYFYEFSKAKIKKAKILTIGDSFSRQGNYGYNNYLAEKNIVLNIDRFLSGNQIQTLYGLSNGDFFETHQIEYVILENVERDFILNTQNINFSKKIMNYQLDSIIKNHKETLEQNHNYDFFSNTTIDFPLSMFRYYRDENYLSNEAVYNVTLKTNSLFSNDSDKLLFYCYDLWNLKKNNDLAKIQKLNNVLDNLANRLRSKNVKLIVLPAPDKYDLYYDYIKDKTNFTEPIFFKYLGALKKNYLYIDSKAILSSQLAKKKDIYFYDDTHWSPISSKIVSDEIQKIIHGKSFNK